MLHRNVTPATASREAIEGLVFEYAERIDRGDFAGVGQLFARAAYRSGAAEHRGADAVRQVLERRVIRYGDGTPRTSHVTTNLVIEVDEEGGTARAHSYFTVLQACEGAPLAPIVTGRYEDAFVREAGVWRFADRRVLVDLVGDVSRHLRRP